MYPVAVYNLANQILSSEASEQLFREFQTHLFEQWKLSEDMEEREKLHTQFSALEDFQEFLTYIVETQEDG